MRAATLHGTLLRGANLRGADFGLAKLKVRSRPFVFCDVRLAMCYDFLFLFLFSVFFPRLVRSVVCDSQDVSFESAVLVGANFEHSEIERLNLTMANLACATLSHVDLRGYALFLVSLSLWISTLYQKVRCLAAAKATMSAQQTYRTPIWPAVNYR